MRLFFAYAVAWCAAYLVCQHPVQAAKLVVLAVNSGTDTTSPYISSSPPNIGPGTKGFLIGIDLQDSLMDSALGVMALEFQNVVHHQGQRDEFGDPLPTPLNIKTRSVAQLQESIDGVVTNGYRRSDTYIMDNAQQTSNVWTPVGPGFEGGEVGDTFFRITSSLGLPSVIDGPGPVQLAYVVATSDVLIPGGIIARGATGFDAGGFAPGSHPLGYVLRFAQGDIVPFPAPPLGTAWSQPAGGIFSEGANWTGGVAPSGTENAVFNLSAAYTVTFNADATSKQLYAINGDVAFDLGGNTYSLTEPVDSVLVAEQPGQVGRMTIANGTLSSVSGAIGKLDGSDGAVTVASGGTWSVAADLTVGNGTGALTVEPGGSVPVGTALRVVDGGTAHLSGGAVNAPLVQVQGGTFNLNSGTLELSGGLLAITADGQFNGAFDAENGDSVTISGAGSAWQSPAAIGVGGAGTGDVMVAEGASVTTTTTRIGFAASSQGAVTVDGAGSTWTSTEGIEVGSEVGLGSLTVTAGGGVTTTYVSIGEFAGADGSLTVTGSGSTATLSDKLEVGIVGQGGLEVQAGGAVSAVNAVIARDLGSLGTAMISGAGSMLTLSGELFVGKGGTGALQITAGGHATNTTARIGFDPGSQGAVTVQGSGSLWQNSDGIELGSEVGSGTMSVSAGGQVEAKYLSIGELSGAHGTATVSGAGSAVVLSEKLEVGVVGAGELHVLGSGSVSAPVAYIARFDGSSGMVEVTGAGSTLATTGDLYVGGTANLTGGTAQLVVESGGTVTVGTALVIKQLGSVAVNGGTLNFTALELAGGSLAQATIDLTGRTASGFGTLDGAVTGSGTVTASGGTLTLGDPTSTSGVSLSGSLSLEENARAVLLDANRADLGSTTMLATGAELSATNGIVVAAGRTLSATGSATIEAPFSNAGTANGPVANGTNLSFTAEVDGAGLFTGNIRFEGPFSPGTSPATVAIAGNATFAPTATLRSEIGGLTAGTLDQVVVSGLATLGGTLDVDLINGFMPALGDSFAVMLFVTRSGDFATYADTELGGHLALKPQLTANSLVLKTLPAIDGDINLDGIVDIFDVNTVSAHWGTPGPQGDVNGDGAVNIFDVNVISGNWHATGSGATVVPEPSTVALSICAASLLLTACRPTFARPAR